MTSFSSMCLLARLRPLVDVVGSDSTRLHKPEKEVAVTPALCCTLHFLCLRLLLLLVRLNAKTVPGPARGAGAEAKSEGVYAVDFDLSGRRS